jgi:hypothetical protein
MGRSTNDFLINNIIIWDKIKDERKNQIGGKRDHIERGWPKERLKWELYILFSRE